MTAFMRSLTCDHGSNPFLPVATPYSGGTRGRLTIGSDFDFIVVYNSASKTEMANMIIRPTFKFIQLGYLFTAVLTLAIGVGVYTTIGQPYGFIALLLLLWPLAKHVRRQLTKLTIEGDKLRYESGLLSIITRTIQLSKVQDVTVRQSLGQRLVGVGDLSIETAGETSRLTIANIDQPQAIADKVMEIAQHGGKPTSTSG